jgi:hypothetical protein
MSLVTIMQPDSAAELPIRALEFSGLFLGSILIGMPFSLN